MGPGAGGGLNIQDMMERLPTIALADVKVGDTITVYVAPHRDGSEGGYVTSAVTASGARFGPRSSAELAREKERAESR